MHEVPKDQDLDHWARVWQANTGLSSKPKTHRCEAALRIHLATVPRLSAKSASGNAIIPEIFYTQAGIVLAQPLELATSRTPYSYRLCSGPSLFARCEPAARTGVRWGKWGGSTLQEQSGRDKLDASVTFQLPNETPFYPLLGAGSASICKVQKPDKDHLDGGQGQRRDADTGQARDGPRKRQQGQARWNRY